MGTSTTATTIADAIALAWDMIEEVQREANTRYNLWERRELLAKRDALTELRRRLRGDAEDPLWYARRAPFE